MGIMAKEVETASTEVWLQAHFREPANFEALAKWFGMAWRTFHRRFHKAFGGTPKAYLQKLRLAAAQQVLKIDPALMEGSCRPTRSWYQIGSRQHTNREC